MSAIPHITEAEVSQVIDDLEATQPYHLDFAALEGLQDSARHIRFWMAGLGVKGREVAKSIVMSALEDE